MEEIGRRPPIKSQSEAHQSADRIRLLRQEFATPELQQLLDARQFDVDTNISQKRASWGMRIASALGGIAICTAVVLFFMRYWGNFRTALQVAIVMAVPLIALAAAESHQPANEPSTSRACSHRAPSPSSSHTDSASASCSRSALALLVVFTPAVIRHPRHTDFPPVYRLAAAVTCRFPTRTSSASTLTVERPRERVRSRVCALPLHAALSPTLGLDAEIPVLRGDGAVAPRVDQRKRVGDEHDGSGGEEPRAFDARALLCAIDSRAAEFYRRRRARRPFRRFGIRWTAWRKHVEVTAELLASNRPPHSHEGETHLVAIDASADPMRLRARHPDRGSVIIVPAVLRVTVAPFSADGVSFKTSNFPAPEYDILLIVPMKKLPLLAMAAALCFTAAAQENAVNPQVQKIVSQVDEQRIHDIIAKLVSFGTRNLMSSQDDPNRGIGAARQWIFDQMKGYSPRLQVRYDKWRVKKQGQRITQDTDLYNVVAVLPGKTMPETAIIISGHYDTLNLGTPRSQGAAGGTDRATGSIAPVQVDWSKLIDLPAPGACDDGSGTSAVMELARVMSQYEFDKTIMFIAFAGEEEGLVGSTLEAAKMAADKQVVEAVLNNDIIGTDKSGNGRMSNDSVSVYTDEQEDSPAQTLGRYAKLMAERYLPDMKVNLMFMQDRLGRGGDHAPFQQEGFAAVRISTPNEIYANQHHATDTLENMSVPYTARVIRINAAIAASLALSPKAPAVVALPRQPRNGQSTTAQPPRENAPGAPPRTPTPMISRGRSGYDAQLRWRPAGDESAIKGYTIVIRATTAPYWEQEIYVGKVNEYLLKDVSIDDVRFGVKAIGADGTESLVAPYVYPARRKAVIETVQ